MELLDRKSTSMCTIVAMPTVSRRVEPLTVTERCLFSMPTSWLSAGVTFVPRLVCACACA